MIEISFPFSVMERTLSFLVDFSIFIHISTQVGIYFYEEGCTGGRRLTGEEVRGEGETGV